MVEIWRFGVVGLLGCVGAIAELTVDIAVSIHPTFAQLTPDNTLGIDKSVVIPIDKDNDRIGGGAARGINLFHSFQDFNVGVGRGVYFANPQGITNIFSRVTGGNSSNILGKLGVLGDANLFLLNPNGILFGKNASLDLQGSFLGTTANGVQFGNQGVFSATNPEAPPLLTINPSALLFNQINQNAGIQNNSIAFAGKDPGGVDVFGLRVPDGKSLLLVGGNVSMDGGRLTANGGRVEIAGLAASGNVELNVAGDTLSLSVPGDVQRGNISLTNQALVHVSGAGKGDIAVNANNLEMSNSFLFAGIGTGLGDGSSKGGDINIQTENLFIKDGGFINSSTFGKGDSGNIFVTARDAISLDKNGIYNNVQSRDAEGNAGNIDIITGSLSVTNGAQINSFTRGLGNGGNITIQARDAVTFDGSGSFSSVLAGGVGNGGKINITAGSLSLINNGQLDVGVSEAFDTNPAGKGKGGAVDINVRDTFTISGTNSGIFGSLGTGAVGRAGDIKVEAGSVFVKDGGEIVSNTFGKGNAGNISITARDGIFLDAASYIYNNVQSSDAEGNAGNIDITTGSLKIENEAGIFAGTFGKGNGGNITVEAKDLIEILSDSNLDSGVAQSARGNAGDITIKTGRLIVRDSQIGPSVFGEGNAGDFNIIASESVELSGQIRQRQDNTSKEGSVGFPGGLFAQIDILGKGRAGNLTIETRHLSVSDGSKIQAATFGDGDAGNIFIRADEIDLFETEKPNFFNTGIFAGVQRDGRVDAGIIDARNGRPPKGQGGNLTIATKKLSLRDGAEVFVETQGEGDAGKLFIRASESVNVMGVSTGLLERQRQSRITAGASQRSTGNGGSLTIETPLLNVADGGIISSNSNGKGTAGDINITANIARLNNGQITAQTASTDGGNINFNLSQYLLLRNGSQISTTAGTAQAGGDGGNININSKFIVAIPEENSDISANAYTGSGGKVEINSQGIFGIESRTKPTEKSDITATSALGVSGVIKINAPDTSSIQNSFTEFSPNVIDTNALIANSCVVRSSKQDGTFLITGSGALRNSPGDGLISIYSTGEVRSVNDSTSRTWKKGEPIIEPQGVYRLADGRLVLSRECH